MWPPPSRGQASGSLAERHEDRNARLGADLASDMSLTSPILGDQDVAGAETPHGAVADLDVDGAREREYRGPAGRVMPRIGSCRIEATHDDAASGNQLRSLGLVAERFPARLDVLEVRLAVGTRVDANDRHVVSFL